MKRGFDPAQARQAPSAVAAWVLGPNGVRWHLRGLAAAAVALVLVNIAVDPVRLWSLPMIGVWAAVLAAHAVLAGMASRWFETASPVLAAPALRGRTWLPTRETTAPAPTGPALVGGNPTAIQAADTDRDAGVRDRSRRVVEDRAAFAQASGSTPTAPAVAAVATRPERDPAPAATDGALRHEVVALWGPSVPAAAPTVVDHYAGWRWGPPSGEPPAAATSFLPVPATDRTVPAPAPAPAARERRHESQPDERVPLSLLAADATPESSSLVGD
ncbi:MAG TPA: hypothetical protein VER37_03740 [Thermomicrobiales bacterium]|nr:hypothetical protein [Thermomicrobiales bacterium]